MGLGCFNGKASPNINAIGLASGPSRAPGNITKPDLVVTQSIASGVARLLLPT